MVTLCCCPVNILKDTTQVPEEGDTEDGQPFSLSHIFHQKQSPYAMPYPFTAARPKEAINSHADVGKVITSAKLVKAEEHPKHRGSW